MYWRVTFFQLSLLNAQEKKLYYSCHPVYSLRLGNPSSVKLEHVVDLKKQTLVIVHGDDLCFVLLVHRANN